MKTLQYKDLTGETADVDEQGRKVKCVWSKMGNVDLDGDMIMPGAFNKSISENGPGGKNLIWSLIDHRASMQTAFGKPEELYELGDQLIAVTPIMDTTLGNDVLKFYMEGMINQHSIGYSTIKFDWMDSSQKVKQLKELKLYEGSAVLWGANPETPMLSLTKTLIDNKDVDPDSLLQWLQKVRNIVKSGTFTDKTFSLLEIEIKQIEKVITDTPAAIALEPLDSKELLDALNSLNSKLQKPNYHGRENSGRTD